MPSDVSAADGGDAQFNQGLARLFRSTVQTPDSFVVPPHTQFTDDECDELDSPVPPLLRQVHPVVEDIGAPYRAIAFADRETTLAFEDVKLVIPAGALLQDTQISIRTIPARQAGALDEGMTNVVPGQRAFRLGPHGLFFQKPITLILPYRPELIPPGMSEEDLGTFYFDGEAGRWRRIRVREVRAGDGVVIAETEHFTDFINATIATPDHPTTASFDQNTIASLKLGDPSAGLELISPPAASSDGAAHLGYRFNIPPGRRGMQPNLTLEYDSEAGNGWMGLGWNIAVSKIQVDSRFGVPKYRPDVETELYDLDGAELSPNGATAGPRQRMLTPAARQPELHFVRRMEGSFSTIIRHGSSPLADTADSYSWEVIDKNGTHYFYGTDHFTRLVDPATGAIGEWLLAKVVDSANNRINYEYQFDSGNLGGAQSWVQAYPKLIRYTDNDFIQGAMYLQFELERSPARADAFSSAREGFLVRTAKRLHALYVVYSEKQLRPDFGEGTPGTCDTKITEPCAPDLVRRYLFNYTTGEYQKTLLQSVDVQGISRAPGTELGDPIWHTDHRTTLSYYQRDSGSVPSFSSSSFWGSIDSDQKLAESSSNTGGSHLYHGAGICGIIHAGLGGGFTAGDETTTQAFLDFNGDGLPDFLKKNTAFLGHRSTSDPIQRVGTNLYDDFSWNFITSYSLGTEVHAAQELLSTGVDVSWDQNLQHGGFADVDGDGLIDWITPHWHIQHNNGTTQTQDIGNFGAPDAQPDQATQDAINDSSPHADPIVRWTAPYTGTVVLGGAVSRTLAGTGEVLAEVWQLGVDAPVWSHVFASTEMTSCTPGPSNSCSGGLTFAVTAGDRFYFRAHAQGDIANTALAWDPQFSYQAVCGAVCSPVSAADHATREPWGAPIFDFSQAADFRLAGPPNQAWRTQVASTVPVTVSGAFTKTAPTADDVMVEVLQTTAAGQVIQRFSQLVPAAWTGSIDVATAVGQIPVSAAVNGGALDADSLHFRVRADSPVDTAAFNWDPVVTYQQYCRNPPEENSTPVCAAVTCPQDGTEDAPCQLEGDPMAQYPLRRGQIVQHAPVTYSSYLVAGTDNFFVKDNLPTVAWAAPEAGAFEATINYSLAGASSTKNCDNTISVNEDDTIVLIQANQRLLGKVKLQPGTASTVTLAGLTALAKDEPLYFTALRKGSQVLQLSIGLRFIGSGQSYSLPAGKLNLHRVRAWDDGGEPDNLSGGYHQWSSAQWSDAPPEQGAPAPIFSASAVEAQPFTCESLNATDHPIPPLTATIPLQLGLPPNNLQQLPGFNQPVWAASGADLYIAAGEMKPSRTGANPQAIALATSGPAFRKSHGSTTSYGFGAGVTYEHSSSDSYGDTDTIDLNGDGYPDWLDGKTVRYGDSRGNFGDTKALGLGDQVRHFTGDHNRFGIGGSVSGGVKQVLGASGNSDSTVSVSASSGRIYGRTRTVVDLIDINGDGLPDQVEREKDSPAKVRLNLGYSFGPTFDLPEVPLFDSSIPSDVGEYTGNDDDPDSLRVQTDVTNSVQGGVGFSAGAGYSGGGGLAYTGTRTLVDLADVNGDGLPDRVLKIPGEQALHVELNLGEQFAPEQVWDLPAWGSELPNGGPLGSLGSRDALAYTEGTEFHLDTSFSYEFSIYLFICGTIEAAAQYRQTHSTSQLIFQDVDGDGFSDQLLKNDGTGDVHVKLNQDGAHHFNLLKTVENPIGGRITLDYSREGNTTALPQNHWAMASVEVDDGLTGTFHDTPHTTNFQYSGGLYNRDERQNFGFAQVTTTRPDKSAVIQSFRQDAVCTKGLLGDTTEQDAAGHLFRSAQTIYDLRAVGASDSCFPAATQEVTSFYDGVTTDSTQVSKSLAEQRDYDEFGNVTFYSNAGDAGTKDDISYTVVYDPALAQDHIFRAKLVTAFDATNTVLRKRQATYFGTGLVKTMNDFVSGGHDPDTGNPYVDQATAGWQFAYVGGGMLTEVTDPTGFHLQYDIDRPTFSYVISTSDSFGYVSTAVPDQAIGTFKSITDANGFTETFTYEHVTPRLTSVQAPGEAAIDPLLQTVTIDYASLAPDDRALFPRTIVRHYDAAHPSNPLETVTFIDGLDRTIQVKKEADVDTGATGVTHGFIISGLTVFDERGRVQAQGLPIFDTDPDTSLHPVALTGPTQYQYDILSRPTLVTAPNGATVTTSYGFATVDGTARFANTATDPNGNKRIDYQDARGQLVRVDQFNTIDGTDKTLTTRYSYNPLGELLEVTDAKGNKTTSVYDTVGQLADLTSPDSGHTSYRYDLSGRLKAKQTPNLVSGNRVITFAYEYNRLISIDLPSTPEVIDFKYTYGFADDPEGERGRLVHVKDPSGDEDRFYDELGRIDSSAFTPNPQSSTAPKPTYTTKFKYDSLNRLLALTYPDGEVVTYGYDNGGALNSVTGKFPSSTTSTAYVQKITYDTFGQRRSITLGNGAVTQYTYDPVMRWLSDINTISGATTIQNNHYTFDTVGNILTAKNNIAIPAPVGANGPIAPGPTSQTFGYDKLYQLTNASGRYDGCACGCNNYRQYSFTQSYDEIGNIKNKTVTDKIYWPTGGRVDTQPKTTYNNSYTYGGPRPHAPTKIGAQTLNYDGDGNQLSSAGSFEVGREVTWNELDQLTKEVDSSTTNTYLYNSAGERTHKRRTTLETVYVNQYYVIRNLLFQTKHIYAGPTRIVSSVVTLNDYKKLTTTQTPVLFYYHSDHLGSTGYITDRTGAILEHEEYLPSGETWFEELKNGSASNRLPWQFNGKELDETGLYYYGARYYNPRSGIWMSPDPILSDYMRSASSAAPHRFGLYTYTRNNPLHFIDPTGLEDYSAYSDPESIRNYANNITNVAKGVWNAIVGQAATTAVAAQLGRPAWAPAPTREEIAAAEANVAPVQDAASFKNVSTSGKVIGAVIVAGATAVGTEALAPEAVAEVLESAAGEGAACAGGGCGGPGVCFVAGTPVTTEHGAVPIEHLALGQRVEAGNAACANEHLPDDARTIHLTIPNPDAPWDRIQIDVVRPISWLAEVGLSGGSAWLELKDVGVAGFATVTGIDAPPPEQPGSGCLVFSTIRHVADRVLNLHLSQGQATETLELTPPHRLFVEGRGWTAASALQPGDRLRSDTGELRVERIEPGATNQMVYNLEVGVEHAYRVGNSRVWAHNQYTGSVAIADDAHVVRGGIATPEQIAKGIGPHRDVPGLAGFSAQSRNGATVEELASEGGVRGGPFPHGKVSVTTAGKLRCIGCDVVRSPGGGANHVTVTPGSATPARISEQFTVIPNPAKQP